MRSFEQFVRDTCPAGAVNFPFERGMYSLTEELEKIVGVLNEASVPFELIGGVAVNVHLLPRHRSRTFVTREIDLLVRRSDLDRIVLAAETAGYEARKIVGGYMLRLPSQAEQEAVHLVFAGERSKSTQPTPHPDLSPEATEFYGLTVPVAPLRDLVRMKLNSFRAKDLVHLEILDDAGLLTDEIEADLPSELRQRLIEARILIAEEQPDEE